MPATRVFYLLVATTLLGVTGVLVPSLAWLALALDGAIFLAFVVDLLRARADGLEAERTWPSLMAQGTASEMAIELRSQSDRPLELRLWDGLHPALAETPERQETALPAEGRIRWTYAFEPRQRGRHRTGPLVARVLGPWRLAWHQRNLLPGEVRQVYPQVRWEGRVGHLLLLAHRRSLGRHPQRLRGMGSEPYALREYLPGDPPVKIHWKASARHGHLITREDTWERGARLLILLDCARGMSGMDGERSKLDHALGAALALVRVAAARGDRVTLVAFSNRVERSVRIHGGHRSLQAAYGKVYDLEARLVEPAFDLAADTAVALESRRSTVVLFTSIVDLAAADLLRRAMVGLERRHRPILINLQDPELVGLALDPPETPAGAFAKVSALEILLANRRLGRRLRRAGVRVVEAPADRLALESLEAYLALFGGR